MSSLDASNTTDGPNCSVKSASARSPLLPFAFAETAVLLDDGAQSCNQSRTSRLTPASPRSCEVHHVSAAGRIGSSFSPPA